MAEQPSSEDAAVTEPSKPRNSIDERHEIMRHLGCKTVPPAHVPGHEGPKDWQIDLSLRPFAIATVIMLYYFFRQWNRVLIRCAPA